MNSYNKNITADAIEKIARAMIEKHKNITIKELCAIAGPHESDPDWYIFCSDDYWLYIYKKAMKAINK